MQQTLEALFQDSRALWIPCTAAEYHNQPTALSFLRDHVSQSLPCVWRSAASSWRAIPLWEKNDFEYLRKKIGQSRIQVTHTPDGRADAVVRTRCPKSGKQQAVFAMPEQRAYPFSQMLDALLSHKSHQTHGGCDCGYVPYYSAQNSSLVSDVPQLVEDIDQSLFQFACDAFNCVQPSVQNIWIGDGRSVSTTHSDPYENMYTVVTGTKIFELRPPCDAAFLSKPSLQRARWEADESSKGNGHHCDVKNDSHSDRVLRPVTQFDGWKLLKEEGETAWIDEDVISDKYADCLRVCLHAGDVLYIPALWYHRVSQRGITIAVNLWYEMGFGRDWIYRELCSGLQKARESEANERRVHLNITK